MDVDSIPPGVDFTEYLREWVSRSDLLLVVIGPLWLEMTRADGLAEPDATFDYVRVEIREALSQKKRVVPVLLDGVPMPAADDLPPDIRPLTRRQAVFVSANADLAQLPVKLGLTLSGAESSSAPRPKKKRTSKSGRPKTRSRSGKTEEGKPDGASSIVPRMVSISPGSFFMGSTAGEAAGVEQQQPRHRVSIAQPFEISACAVTFDEFDAFCEQLQREKPDDEGWGRGRRPVINVSFADVEAYIGWLNRQMGIGWRLPSEAEWEYCCRAGTTGHYHFTTKISPEVANYDGTYRFYGAAQGIFRQQTVPVATFKANSWGLHEMHGNVWEWCADSWHETYDGAPVDGSAWLAGDGDYAVVRGGSWFTAPMSARSAARFRYPKSIRRNDLGFRLARTVSR